MHAQDFTRTMSFREITIKEIGKETSFTRTSIYNYFQTKEEIFLALFQQEYELWTGDLEELLRTNETFTGEGFAEAVAHTLEKRERLLKLMAMNHYDMEANSRMENLVEFKIAYKRSIEAVTRCLDKFFPEMTEKEQDGFYLCVLSVHVRDLSIHGSHCKAERSDGNGRDCISTVFYL